MFGRKKTDKNGVGSTPSSANGNLAANLQDDQLRFKVIIDSIEDGVVMVDTQKVVRLINPAAATLCGWDANEASGIDVSNIIKLVNDKEEPYSDANNPFTKVLTTGQAVRDNSAFLLDRNKRLYPLSLNVSPLFDELKQVMAVVAVFRDVSNERAEEQRRADFVSTASHEMRTPVAAIEGYLSLALNDKVATIDVRARNYLGKAHDATQHLGQLFQDLLTSAKAEDGRLTSHPSVIEIGAFLEQVTNDLRFVAEKKRLLVEYVVGSSTTTLNDQTSLEGGEHVIRPLYYVHADADRLREVITNLFDNAVKYTTQGKVTIGLNGNEQIVQCYVRDTGPGIPAADLPHLFQKFYRVDNTATRTVGGTGLGLFICRKIVELYSGRLWVESKEGEGSTFFINLPRLSTQQANAQLANEVTQNDQLPINSLGAP